MVESQVVDGLRQVDAEIAKGSDYENGSRPH